ncbi:MAG TPA: hypothetical protein VGA98_12360, partial [Allosphingosinicella sp.]
IPAKAGIPGQEVSAGLHETPASAGVTDRANPVIPAKAGIPGQEVSAGLHQTPAFAGVTMPIRTPDPRFRRDDDACSDTRSRLPPG